MTTHSGRIGEPGIVFDLDDTLYLEAGYVRSGFRAVARLVAQTGLVSEDEARDYLQDCFERGIRRDTFDRLLKEMPPLNGRFRVPELVEAYRTHRPEIDFLQGMRELLVDLRGRGIGLAVISDGFLESQRRKAAALELERLVERVVLTDGWGRGYWKPNPRAFEHLAEKWNIPAGRLVYIGDNPAKDFLAPNRLGWWTVRLRMAGQLRADGEAPTAEHAARVAVSSVDGLARCLEDWI